MFGWTLGSRAHTGRSRVRARSLVEDMWGGACATARVVGHAYMCPARVSSLALFRPPSWGGKGGGKVTAGIAAGGCMRARFGGGTGSRRRLEWFWWGVCRRARCSSGAPRVRSNPLLVGQRQRKSSDTRASVLTWPPEGSL
jgi:hypothetical protein